MKHFVLNRQKNLIVFKQTSQLAGLISETIGAIRDYAKKIDADMGKQIKRKTPGKTKVKLVVRFALRSNAFNYKKLRFEYQVNFGIITRPINWKLNKKIKSIVGNDTSDTAAIAVHLLLTDLMKREGVPAVAADPAAKCLAMAVMSMIADETSPATKKDLLEGALFAKSTVAAAGQAIKAIGKVPAGSFVEIDQKRHLLLFKNTQVLATSINTAIKELREFSGTVPQIGASLKSQIVQQTPGPRTVRLAISQGLKNNAFNYETGEFQSQGWKIGTTRIVNHFANKRLKKFLVFNELAEKCIAKYVSAEYLKHLPKSEFRDIIAARFAARVLDLAVAT